MSIDWSIYRHPLLNDVLPFWEKYAKDEHGGIHNQLDVTGKTVGTDKFLWSQGRGLWTFSTVALRYPEFSHFHQLADHIFAYIANVGPTASGDWDFRLDSNGKVLDGPISIYVNGFIIAGLTAYIELTQSEEAKELLLNTYTATCRHVQSPDQCRVAPYTIPEGLKTHGIPMIFCWVFYHAGRVLQDRTMIDHALELCREVLSDFYRPEQNAILEFATTDGHYSDTPAGRTCVPGHALEGLWFILSIMRQEGITTNNQLCCELILRHLELAWDNEFGGLSLACDINGEPSGFWQRSDCKAWWVHCEALVATAYGFALTTDQRFLEWHRLIHDYTWQHYPAVSGEWHQWLTREGDLAPSAALPVQDPFHLPRALMELDRILPAFGFDFVEESE